MSDPFEESDLRAAGNAGDIRVALPTFEGPLDLLLHLIRTNKMDIFDIPIIEVARQYGEYIDLMKEMNLELAGEFLLMAATLAHIKSRMLLPVDRPADGEEEEDPRAELTRQLVDHQRYRLAAENLQALESLRNLVWARPAGGLSAIAGEPELIVDLYSLLAAFKRLMDQVAAGASLRASRERISVAQTMEWMKRQLDGAGRISFLELMSSFRSRGEMIAAFLALLELIRMRAAIACQQTPLGEIWISGVDPPPMEGAGQPPGEEGGT